MSASATSEPGAPFAILVHGGAGSIDDRQEARHRSGCERAAEAGREVLAQGGSAVDAVVAAVRVLEDDDAFNAGTGSTVDGEGMITCDASVMRGEDLAYGAVGAVAGVPHAVELARAVLDDGKYSLLVGPGAVRFARAHGIPLVDPWRLEVDPSRSSWWSTGAEKRHDPKGPADSHRSSGEKSGDTVGAVARDANGRLAAATSTGGLLGKHAGRVGDSPIAGAGVYARDGLGAASATGHGETLMKIVAAYAALVAAREAEPGIALCETLSDGLSRVGGRGGIIAALPDGRVAWARNTLHMGYAYALGDRALVSGF
ncbi:MAG: isoaspartyl peptidase/L-asparaginase [Deltaproteobacteria bacterium]|nr:isoaspartyl peptidase/L-asparaginase [Deltaproteobacteria bacterium]